MGVGRRECDKRTPKRDRRKVQHIQAAGWDSPRCADMKQSGSATRVTSSSSRAVQVCVSHSAHYWS